jgi:hypothetical protein
MVQTLLRVIQALACDLDQRWDVATYRRMDLHAKAYSVSTNGPGCSLDRRVSGGGGILPA